MKRALLLAAALLLLPAPAAPAGPGLKAGSVLHLVSKKHDHPYSLYVPGNYSPKASWPLVLSNHGRGSAGKKEIGQWTGLAKEFGFIVACPDMCTATVNRPPTSKLEPAEEDDEVLLSVYEEVCANFRVNRRAVMITGFSGGGNPSYYTGLRHPDLISHICTRGGNFARQQIPREEKVLAAGRSKIQVYIYYGENDHELILGKDGEPGQAKMAHEALVEAGYEHVKIEMIQGMGHQSRPRIAAEWFGAYLKANRKLFAAGDRADRMLADLEEALGKEKYKDAVRSLLRLEDHEKKSKLDPISPPARVKIEGLAAERMSKARQAHDAGDLKQALKILGRVSRDFRGLPAAEEAKALTKEWKE